MFGKIITGLILLAIIGAIAYVALVDVTIPQEDVVLDINPADAQK